VKRAEPTEAIIRTATPEEARAALDYTCRYYLQIGAEEFLRRHESGEYRDASECDSRIGKVLSMLEFERSIRPMTPKQALEQKRTELRTRLAEREPIEVARVADPMDDGLQYSARDVATAMLAKDREQLRQVEAALLRLDTPAWGICLECGEPIAPKRLAAVAWAECCLGCQEREEQQLVRLSA
jgi:DnaK suppressor protein